MLDSKLGAWLVIYGPSGLGFIVLSATCLSAKRNLSILWASIIALLMHLVSVVMLAVLVGMGEAWSGQTEAHNFPTNYCWIGIGALALPVLVRLICFMIWGRDKRGVDRNAP